MFFRYCNGVYLLGKREGNGNECSVVNRFFVWDFGRKGLEGWGVRSVGLGIYVGWRVVGFVFFIGCLGVAGRVVSRGRGRFGVSWVWGSFRT